MSNTRTHRLPALRKVIGVLAILTLLAAVLTVTAFAWEGPVDVHIEMGHGLTDAWVNGTHEPMDIAPYVSDDGQEMIPLRILAEAMGAEVSWDAATDSAVVVCEGQTTKVKAFENTMLIDGEVITMDTQSDIRNGRIMVPVRAAARAVDATAFYYVGVISVFVRGESVKVENFRELQQAVDTGVKNIELAPYFDTTHETTTKVIIERPLVLDGNGANIDFGFEVLSNGVTIKNFNITTSEFDKAVSAPGKNGGPGDCIVVEIHNDNTGDPVVITGLNIVHDIFGNKNSAIYLADGSYVEITDNNIKVENKEKNAYERGGIFVGAGVSGKISGNTIDAALTGFPMSPIGLATTLDKLTEDVKVAPVVITHNKVTSIYVTKMYASGTLFGEDGNILKDDNDFGVREALSKFLVDLEKNNTFTLKEGYPVEHESGYVQCRLDKIMAGAPYYEKNVFFNVTDGKLVAVPAPAEG